MAKGPKRGPPPEVGHHFGKPDLERLGLFIEMPYMNGKGYVSPFPSKNTKSLKLIGTYMRVLIIAEPRPDKGFNMMCEGPKSKNATQSGYFETEFKRIFNGECIPGRGRKP